MAWITQTNPKNWLSKCRTAYYIDETNQRRPLEMFKERFKTNSTIFEPPFPVGCIGLVAKRNKTRWLTNKTQTLQESFHEQTMMNWAKGDANLEIMMYQKVQKFKFSRIRCFVSCSYPHTTTTTATVNQLRMKMAIKRNENFDAEHCYTQPKENFIQILCWKFARVNLAWIMTYKLQSCSTMAAVKWNAKRQQSCLPRFYNKFFVEKVLSFVI